MRSTRLATRRVAIALTALTIGCSGLDRRLQQHHEKLASLESTTVLVARAWLSGDVSGTYTTTALEQTFALVEQERAALASAPQALLDPRGARLSQAAERLSRLIAVMINDVRAADAPAVRRGLAAVPITSRHDT
jgi:hypothetical protein